MKKTIIYRIITVVASGMMLVSCSDKILDITPKDRISDLSVWSDAKLIRAYHTSLYNCVLSGYRIHMQSKLTDEAFCSINFGPSIVPFGQLTPDNVTAVSINDWTSGGNLYIWDEAYKYIRRINLFFEEIDKSELELEDKDQLIAEAKFLRAYIYFNLVSRFGGVPILEQAYNREDNVTMVSNTFDECIDFITKNIEEAMPDLPDAIMAGDSNFGRASKAACQALLSRTYLYAASPLFNPSNDKAKWQKAAKAAKDFIDNYPQYELYPSYRDCFNQPSGSVISEIIFSRNFSSSSGHQQSPYNLNNRYLGNGGWWGSNGPTQNLVDDYDMTNGEPPFIWNNGVKTINPASGYDPQNPYANRDPRLDATVLHDGSTFHNETLEMWVASDGKSYGYDNYRRNENNPRSGYVLRKFNPEEGDLTGAIQHTEPWIIFRTAEIYLNYAEAEFELGNEAVAREYINKVRARANMPGLPDSVTGETLRTRLYNERRVEFAFEEHRYFDVRRWKIAMDTENRSYYGVEIVKDVNTGEMVYNDLLLAERKFTEPMYLLPIETNEIRKNNGTLLQTVTWR